MPNKENAAYLKRGMVWGGEGIIIFKHVVWAYSIVSKVNQNRSLWVQFHEKEVGIV